MVLVIILFIIPLLAGCGSKDETNASFPEDSDQAAYDQSEQTIDSNSLDARVDEYSHGDVAKGERVPGEVGVILKGGITEEEAYQIFASHGFERQSVEKSCDPQMYLLHFSEDERDIKSVIRELLLDGNVITASTNLTTYETLDY